MWGVAARGYDIICHGGGAVSGILESVDYLYYFNTRPERCDCVTDARRSENACRLS